MSKRQRLFSFRLGSFVKKLILAENLRFRWNFEKESQVFEGSLVCTVTMQSADCVPCSLQTAYLAPCSLQTAQVLRLRATYSYFHDNNISKRCLPQRAKHYIQYSSLQCHIIMILVSLHASCFGPLSGDWNLLRSLTSKVLLVWASCCKCWWSPLFLKSLLVWLQGTPTYPAVIMLKA